MGSVIALEGGFQAGCWAGVYMGGGAGILLFPRLCPLSSHLQTSPQIQTGGLKKARSCISLISYSNPDRFSKPYREGFTESHIHTHTYTHSAFLLAHQPTHTCVHSSGPPTSTHTQTGPPNLYIPPQRSRPAPGANLERSLYRLEVWAFCTIFHHDYLVL